MQVPTVPSSILQLLLSLGCFLSSAFVFSSDVGWGAGPPAAGGAAGGATGGAAVGAAGGAAGGAAADVLSSPNAKHNLSPRGKSMV